MAHLNQQMIIDQKCTATDVAMLHQLHTEKDELFERARSGIPTAECMQPIVQELREVEYAMQEAWHFTPDSEKHTWKYFIPNSPFDFPEEGSWAYGYIMGQIYVSGLTL